MRSPCPNAIDKQPGYILTADLFGKNIPYCMRYTINIRKKYIERHTLIDHEHN
jgi:hypothetical protein